MPITDPTLDETPATVEPYPAPTFVLTASFEDAWADAGFKPADLNRLFAMLVEKPNAGDVMSGTGGLRKVRFAPAGKGKSGAARVCYATFAVRGGLVLLFTLFTKSEKSNLSMAEKNAAAVWLAEFEAAVAEYDALPFDQRRGDLPSNLGG